MATMEIVMALGVFAFMALLWASARAATTVCVLEIRDGKVEVKSGGLAPRILSDVKDIARRPRIAQATLRVSRDRDRAALSVRGHVSEAQEQQLRNVVGSVPLAKVAAGKKRRR